jgi:hypothetical protein
LRQGNCSIFPSSYCVETPLSFTGNKTSAAGNAFWAIVPSSAAGSPVIEGDVNGKAATAAYTAAVRTSLVQKLS